MSVAVNYLKIDLENMICDIVTWFLFIIFIAKGTISVLIIFFFFFKQKTAYEIQRVTGVQTCALPICRRGAAASARSAGSGSPWRGSSRRGRSEERRVGKECSLLCRSRCSAYH